MRTDKQYSVYATGRLKYCVTSLLMSSRHVKPPKESAMYLNVNHPRRPNTPWQWGGGGEKGEKEEGRWSEGARG